MISERVRHLLEGLLREVQGFSPLREPRDVQWAQLGMWAARYRLLLEEVGHGHADDPEFKSAFRVIRTKMASIYPDGKGPYIPGLRLDDERDWAMELEVAKKRCEEILRRHRLYTEVWGKLSEVESFLAQGDPKSEEDERRLYHLIRDCARYEHLRGELADILECHRQILPDEFGFLWAEATEAKEPETRERLSHYDIMCRILRRLIQKDIIGARYCPIDMVTLGFDGSDRGHAKVAVDLLVHTGVLLAAKGGTTVSLAPKWVFQVRKFLAGERMGVPAVDEWAST